MNKKTIMKAENIYILTILHTGNEFSYNQCMLDFDDLLNDCFEEGYVLSNRMFLFFSNESFDNINRRLDTIKGLSNYSHCLVDCTESVINSTFKLDIDRIFTNQKEIAQVLMKSIDDFKNEKTKKILVLKPSSNLSKKEVEMDRILDKIHKLGKDSLTRDEENFLSNYNE